MRELASLLMIVAFGMVFFVLPIGGIILFVQLRAKARRAMLEGPWSALAREFGGQLAGERVVVTRDVYQLTLDMRLVSVMQAVGSPYYSDGGTFTEAALCFDPRSEHRVAGLARPARIPVQEIQRLLRDSPLNALPPDARVVLAEREARVVFPGPVGDPRALGAAFAGLQGLAETIRKHGPVPVNV